MLIKNIKEIVKIIPNSLCDRLDVATIPPLSNVPVCASGEGCVYRYSLGGFNGEKIYLCRNPNEGVYTKFKDLD